MMLTGLASVARKAGLRVVEVPGWETRGHGGMSGVRTITCHHTANGGASGNYPSLRVVRDGRPGLPGPLSQLGLGLDGTVYVIAAGKSYHAGESRSIDYTNSYAIGIEAEARGTGWSGDWPDEQMRAYHRLCKALVQHYTAPTVEDVRAHKETCAPAGRKSDPSFGMVTFRTAVSQVDLTEPLEEHPLAGMSNAEIDHLGDAIAKRVHDIFMDSDDITDFAARERAEEAGEPTTGPAVSMSLSTAISSLVASGRALRNVEFLLGELLTELRKAATPPQS